MKRTFLLLAILASLIGYFGYSYGYSYYVLHQQSIKTSQLQDQIENRLNPAKARDIMELRKRLFRSVRYAFPPLDTLKDAAWQRGQRARASAALSQEKYDYIVLPIEQNAQYYDRITRLMAARWMAARCPPTTTR